jgi:hypothetical protein
MAVTSALAAAFRSELPCSNATAALLSSLAQEWVPRLGGTVEDSEEDLVLRLRDPRIFGAFVESVAGDGRVTTQVRTALIEHAFDLLPLPRTEGEVIAVESRAPRHLLALAAALAAVEDLSVLHVMHLVYAIFLDRSLVADVPRKTRSVVLQAILSDQGSEKELRLLYAGLALAAVPEPEAASELRRILKMTTVPVESRRALAAMAAADDGGRSALTRIAQRQGLLPADLSDSQSPTVLANIPRMPARLSASGLRFLKRSGPV